MTISKDTFFRPFERLTNEWLPQLGLSLSSNGTPRSESQAIGLDATFNIDFNYTSKEWGGINSYNCSNVAEVTANSKQIIDSSINGRLKSVCDILYSELSNHSLFSSLHRNTLPIQTFEYSCLVMCSPCNGRGKVRCTVCHGSGKVDEWRNEIVGYDEYRDSRGYVTRRDPRYQNRCYKVNCHNCYGSGERTCTTCTGDGQNTYVETVDVYAKNTKSNHKWTKFESALWVNDYLHGNQKQFALQNAGDWNLSEQVVLDKNDGSFTVNLPGVINAVDCQSTMHSRYANSQGLLKTLGGLAYDCDFIYSEHTYQAASQAISEDKLDANDIVDLTSSKIFNTCGESSDGGESVSSDDLIAKKMITKKSSKEMFKLLTLLKDGFAAARSKLSLNRIVISTLIMFVLISLPLMTGAWFHGVAVYESFSLVNLFFIIKIIVSDFSISPQYLNQFTVAALVLFIPSIVLMKLFGVRKNWTTKRILRWFWVTGPLLAAVFILFTNASKTPLLTNPSMLFDALPKLDVFVIALLAGIFLARKKSWGNQEKAASLYQSDVLMKKLDYKE